MYSEIPYIGSKITSASAVYHLSMRPVQCRTYPFWSFLLADRKTWDEECSTCPGINSGEFHDFAEIKKAKTEYELNYPIRKSDFQGE